MTETVHLEEPIENAVVFKIHRPDGGWRRVFTTDYIQELRPVAEVLAMIDKKSPRDYALFMHEADAVYRFRQGKTSWEEESEDPVIQDLLQKIKLIRKLKGKQNENFR